jgi:hypothetical protein
VVQDHWSAEVTNLLKVLRATTVECEHTMRSEGVSRFLGMPSRRPKTAASAKMLAGSHDLRTNLILRPCTAPELACRVGMVSDRGELEWIGRGFDSRIAFWTMVCFAQEHTHARKAQFPDAQCSRPLTSDRSAIAGSRVSRNKS